jgi:hypothetical protein
MRTSSARANGWRCPQCGDVTTRDESGQGFVRHTTNRTCEFEKGQRDSGGVGVPSAVPKGSPPPRAGSPFKQGQETGAFGRWLTDYLRHPANREGSRVYYDHGDSSEPNVVAIKGFFGAQVSNLNRLADVDVMVVSRDQRARLLVEIEERDCSPKKILGDIMAISMCNHFAVRESGQQRYFDVDCSTHLVIAGVLPPQGNRLQKVDEILLPRIRQLTGFPDGIAPTNVDLVFRASIDETIRALQTLAQNHLPRM